MIKLIATDLDGTLLDEDKNLPPDFLPLLDLLLKRGICFVAASGRSSTSLRGQFGPYDNQITCICDNGACLMENGVITQTSPLPKETIHRIVQVCREIPDIQLVLAGAHNAHISPYTETFSWELEKYYPQHQLHSHLEQVGEGIFKVAVFDMAGAASNSYPILKAELGSQLSMAVSGDHWMDIMNPGINKGAALSSLQRKLGISYEETMAFGDFYNDVEMLQQAKYSFVMENANHDLRQYGNYIAKSNQEYGVVQAIRQYAL
ncbi:MAG: HAD family phosphatase [Clostridiales bacterium]|jgi:Cof subfamily protein (haloacid dehalogenase superfamily)|nr:HAD family phosphatase [Clostridiales bacterium]